MTCGPSLLRPPVERARAGVEVACSTMLLCAQGRSPFGRGGEGSRATRGDAAKGHCIRVWSCLHRDRQQVTESAKDPTCQVWCDEKISAPLLASVKIAGRGVLSSAEGPRQG